MMQDWGNFCKFKKINIFIFLQSTETGMLFCFNFYLTLINVTDLRNNAIYPNWLSLYAVYRFTGLELNINYIEIIENDSFSTETFVRLEVLHLKNMSVTFLDIGILNGLEKLSIFTLDGLVVEHISEGILYPVRRTLSTLTLIKLSEIDLNLYNLTGCIALPRLQTVSVTYCRMPRIRIEYFDGLTSIKHLYLTGNEIESIDSDSFRKILNTIQLIDLRENKLTRIDGVFDLYLPTQQFQVYLGDNNWNCNPLSGYLENLLENHGHVFPDPICVGPTISLQCFHDDSLDGHEDMSASIGDTGLLIKSHENGSVSVAFRKETENHVIVVMSNDLENNLDLKCHYSEFSKFEFVNLIEDTTYTFCAMNKYKTTVTPLNCLPYHHQIPREPKVMWISMNDKTNTVIMLFFVYLFCIMIGPPIVYVLCRQYPILLSGGKGVIIVMSKSEVKMSPDVR